MVLGIRQPLLIAGLGLTTSVWLMENLHHSFGSWGTVCVLGAGAFGIGNWWLRQRSLPALDLEPTLVDRTAVETALAEVKEVINQLQLEATTTDGSQQVSAPQIATLHSQIAHLTTELDRDRIRLAVIGGKSVGKTSLFQLLQTEWATSAGQKLNLRDTPGLFDGSDINPTEEAATWERILESDLILFVTTGDLTEPEFQALQKLATARKRILLVFNKQDQYLPTERRMVVQRLQERTREILREADVVAIAAQPISIKVRQYQPDGSIQERMEQPAPELAELTDRLNQVLLQEGQQLVLASSYSNVRLLKAQAKSVLNGVRRARAVPIIEKYQWITAATAFASPFPAVDLLATAAINAQMVLDISALYQQRFSLDQAKTIAGTMASLLLKLGLVEFSTHAVTSLLKSNAATFVAGGAVQGVSAAYLTRLAGLSLVEYFQEFEGSDAATIDAFKLTRLTKTLQSLFQQNQRIAFLQSFVQQAITHLSPQTTSQQALALEGNPNSASHQATSILSQNEASVPSTP